MKQHRLVIVGTGVSVGNQMEAIKKLGERVNLVAAVDLTEAKVKRFCEENGIPRWYTNYTEMLERESPDLVCIVTPPATHKALSIEALEAGAWVFCEKPLCASLADFDEIQAAEKRTGRYVSTVFQWRFGSAGKHLKKLIQQGIFGKPLLAICNTLWYRNQAYYDVYWRGSYATEFGGPTMTLGIHLMDFYLSLMGDWQELRAMIGTLDRNISVEDVSMAMVRFQNGAMGSIVNSALSPRQETNLRLDFQKATVEVKALYRYQNEDWQISFPPDSHDESILSAWSSIEDNFPATHDRQISEILDAMETNQAPPVIGEEARRILEFNASLYKSAMTGKPVVKGEIDPDDPFYYGNDGKGKASS